MKSGKTNADEFPTTTIIRMTTQFKTSNDVMILHLRLSLQFYMLCSYQHKSILGIVLFNFPNFILCSINHSAQSPTNTVTNMSRIGKHDHWELFVAPSGTPSWFKHTYAQLSAHVAGAL